LRGLSRAALAASLLIGAPARIAAAGAPAAAPATRTAAPATTAAAPTATAAAPAAIYCPRCGAANRPGSRFCTRDGAPLPGLDEGRRTTGFQRASGTFSPEEVQQVMNRVAGSVVRIRARPTATYRFPVAYYKDEEAEYFGSDQLGRAETSPSDARLAGSGFVIEARGTIATNAHVARPYDLPSDLTVETQDGRSLSARLLGVDVASDLALLKVEDTTMIPLEWGDSNALSVGQETWAIGNPLDIGISIARGTISGIMNVRQGLNQVESFIHSDAHITHGNSGGPLVDVYGHVLGVSDMIASEDKGQGYSIPSGMARLVVDRLRRSGAYQRGYLGLEVKSVDDDAVKRLALKRTDGVLVESVIPGTPAAAAGMQPGDVLYGIQGREAAFPYLMQEAVSSVGPGGSIRLSLVRAGREMQQAITTALRPAAPHIDPLTDWERYLRLSFQEDAKSRIVLVREPHYSRRAAGLGDGDRIKSVLPAQDWPDEPITLSYYKTRAHPVPIRTLEDLRLALSRSYLGGRLAASFEVGLPQASIQTITSIAFDEVWPIIL
jgi:S1-C subfamily serine protease